MREGKKFVPDNIRDGYVWLGVSSTTTLQGLQRVMATKRICVIGAGCSGLTAIKCCLDEGLEPTCFERSHEIGGLWRYEDGDKIGATVYSTTVINSSKETLAYSDFPIPKEFPNFMHHTKLMEYFNLYAERFNLRKYIRFHSEVVSCRMTEDFDSTGRWELTVRDIETDTSKIIVFDGIMVCIGHHAIPHYPIKEFPGHENFKGMKLHSKSYRDSAPFAGKRVTVVGIGNSGCDIAVELSRNAKKVCLSTRRGTWVFNRIMDNGIPYDFLTVTRLKSWLCKTFPSAMNAFYESMLNARFNHEKYGLKPKHRVLCQHTTINDELPNRIVNGTIEIRNNITQFTENGVIFQDGTEEEMDAVIFATGFSYQFPFLEEDILDAPEHESNLYQLMWPMSLKQNSLAVIGLLQTSGVIAPCAEIQSRWAARVFTGSCNLPSNDEMKRKYEEMMENMRIRFLGGRRHTIEVDGVDYMDEVAQEIGCKPNLFKLALSDPALAWKVFNGPLTSFQYRLQGPGQWSDARKTIMGHMSRMWYPIARKEVECETRFPKKFLSVLICLVVAILFAVIVI